MSGRPRPAPRPAGPLLCADIGNSHTVLGLVRDGEVLDHWRVQTDERRTADEWGLLLEGLLTRSAAVDHGPPDAVAAPGPRGTAVPAPQALAGIALCATVPTVLHEWREMLVHFHPGVPHVLVEPGVRTGVPVLMDNPREVGADRVVNALAASTLYDGPVIVVDLGTATTFDVVSAQGQYVGGAIAPGIAISLEALGRRGAQLREVELVRPRSVIAKNTVEALQSGVLHGFASQVDGIVERMAEELGVELADLHVVATGGQAPLVVDECRTVTEHRPLLTLLGLEMVFRRNT